MSWSKISDVKLSTDSHSLSLDIKFPAVDWRKLQSVYGWSALQYQAWIRGSLTVKGNSSQVILLYTDNVLEFWLAGQHYFGGDFYAFRRAPLVLDLPPGSHRFDIRIIRDVRAMGASEGADQPNVSIQIKVEKSEEGLSLQQERLLVPDVVKGRLAGEYGSLTLRNDGHRSLNILSVEAVDVGTIAHHIEFTLIACKANLHRKYGTNLSHENLNWPKSATSISSAFTETRFMSVPLSENHLCCV